MPPAALVPARRVPPRIPAVLPPGRTPTLAAERTLDKIKRSGVMVVGPRTGSPPFGFINKQNEWVGFAIDPARLISADTPLWLCEGEKKALAVAQLGLSAVGFAGSSAGTGRAPTISCPASKPFGCKGARWRWCRTETGK